MVFYFIGAMNGRHFVKY